MVQWYHLHRRALSFSSEVIASGLKVVFRNGVGSRCVLDGSISCHKMMKSWYGFTGNPQDRTLLCSFSASVTWHDLWGLETWILIDQQLRCFRLMGAGSWENSTSMKIYPMFLWEDRPSHSPESLGMPHADHEPSLSISFRAGRHGGGPSLWGL